MFDSSHVFAAGTRATPNIRSSCGVRCNHLALLAKANGLADFGSRRRIECDSNDARNTHAALAVGGGARGASRNTFSGVEVLRWHAAQGGIAGAGLALGHGVVRLCLFDFKFADRHFVWQDARDARGGERAADD